MKALICGSAGQDGYYLKEFLESKGYEVVGFDKGEWFVEQGFDEIYNLAGVTDSEYTFENCRETFEVNTLGCLNMLEFARKSGAKIFQASSAMQSSLTPYGISKLAAHRLTKMYREVHGVYAVSGILHNHVSPLSKKTVVNKICDHAKRGEVVELGNIYSVRDWTHAKDIVKAMWLTLQQPEPDDYEICSGELHSVLDVVNIAGAEFTYDSECLKRGDQDKLSGDQTKIMSLGWKPEYKIEDIIKELMQ